MLHSATKAHLGPLLASEESQVERSSQCGGIAFESISLMPLPSIMLTR